MERTAPDRARPDQFSIWQGGRSDDNPRGEPFAVAALELANVRLAQEQTTRAQVDRLRRRYLRQAEAAGARPDGDPSGTGGRGVRRCAPETRYSHRPEGRAPQERIACEVTGARKRRIGPIAETEVATTDPPGDTEAAQPAFSRPS